MSSFTAAEFGDVRALTRALDKKGSHKAAAAAAAAQESSTNSLQQQHAYTGGITPLHLAAQHGHVAATWLLLEQGHPVDGRVEEDANNSKTSTPLHRASFSGAIATMKLLLEQQANILARDESFGDQRTPLHKAAAGGRYLAVALLLDALREQQRLPEGLTAVDRNHKSALQVAQGYQSMQQEERQNVARWDVVAGGVADWDKCVALLSKAALEIERDSSNSNNTTSVLVRSSHPSMPDNNTTITNTKTTRLSAQLPRHRFAEVDCLDCEQNGECVTATWSAAFQKALQQSVLIPPQVNNRDPNTSVDLIHQQSNLVEETIGMEVIATMTDSMPVLIEDGPNKNSSSSSSMGRACEACGKKTIVLFPSSAGDGLVCKKCKPKRRSKMMANS